MVPTLTMYIIFISLLKYTINIEINKKLDKIKAMGEHTTVADSTFPFVAAILKKSTYISAGALIDESWVLTAADSLFLVRESSRMIHVRLGSINYRKGGFLSPVQFIEIHPYFDDRKPLYDLALIKLPTPVKLTPSLHPIRLQKRPRKVVATHFIVTAWPVFKTHNRTKRQGNQDSVELMKRRMLAVSHLHPTDSELYSEELDMLVPDHNNTKTIMCLDPGFGSDPCQRETGAPVVLNGILWGVISSWKSEDCDVEGGVTFVALVSAKEVSSWIHSIVHGKRWNRKRTKENETENLIY